MKKVTAILLGAGGRGNVYSLYAKECPDEFEIVAVAEPNAARREKYKNEYGIAAENAVETWEELLARPRMADAALVCTLDEMHVAPAVRAMELGYHILLEKPMANHEKDCIAIAEAARKYNRILSICHVLRYTPFYSAIKQLVDEGVLGQIMAVQQTENVGYWHQAHSFVRGNWRNSEETAPMILAKCCHDLDVLSWIVGGKCTSVSSYGSLAHFKGENAPENAPAYCLDGCPAKDNCIYYAPQFYLEHPRAKIDGYVNAVTTDDTQEGILSALKQGPYGRCVYHCDNNVVDHQTVNAQYDNGAVVNLIMAAFSEECDRTIHIMGTKGELNGRMEKGELSYRLFGSEAAAQVELQPLEAKGNYHHGGGDFYLIRDFVHAIQADDQTLNRTTAEQSLQSHLMCFAAEKSRLSGSTVKM